MSESKFDHCAEAYNAYRPEYPNELYEYLGERFNLRVWSLIVDVGAGTGKASIAMAKHGWKVIGIELSESMIEQGKASAKNANVDIEYIQGKAEKMDIEDEKVDLVTSAQAFHWFDAPVALKEIHRVLKPEGGLGIWWNSRDKKKAPYLQEFQDLVHKYNSNYNADMWGTRGSRDWEQVIETSGLYSQIKREVFYHETYMTVDEFMGLTQSFSYVGTVMSKETKQEFFKELRPLLEKNARDGKCWVPYFTELWSASKK